MADLYEQRLKLLEAFRGHTRGQRVGLFLAMLELVRLREITVRQRHLSADIVLKMAEDSDGATKRRSDEGANGDG